MLKRLTLVLMLALAIFGASAQEPSETIILVPFTDNNYGISGVVPSSWTQYSQGLWLRETGAQALLAQQGIIGDFNEIVAELLVQLQISGMPEPVETIPANGLDWTLHVTEGPAGTGVVVDWAVTTDGVSVYIILLQSPGAERDALRESVFIPAVNALTPTQQAPLIPEDADYTAENVVFTSGAINLAGTLTIPAGSGPHPAVILITGSGAQDRDERLAGMEFAPFAVIADAFARAGIATLRYDDRGYGRSGGDFASATTLDFAEDAAAAFRYLLDRAEIDPMQIGYLGHSEGANAAAHLAEGGIPAAFYVLMAGPGVNGTELLIEQNRRIYAAEGLSAEATAPQIAFISEMFPLVLNGDTQGMGVLLERRVREQTAELTEDEIAQIGDLEALIGETVRTQLADFSRPWWPYFLRYDPAAAWATVTVPVLALFGARDVQVDAEQNATALGEALDAAPTGDFEIVTLPTANHLFQNAGTGAISEYGSLHPVFTEDFLPTVTAWILDHVTLPE